MPVSDASYMLRAGTTNLSANEQTPAAKHVGPGPIHGMKVFFHCDTVTGTSPTLDLKFQESDDNVTFTDVPGGAFAQFSGTSTSPIYAELHLHWTKRYLRHHATVGGTTPVYTNAQIGLTPGEIATT